jgi:hypothetical protein
MLLRYSMSFRIRQKKKNWEMIFFPNSQCFVLLIDIFTHTNTLIDNLIIIILHKFFNTNFFFLTLIMEMSNNCGIKIRKFQLKMSNMFYYKMPLQSLVSSEIESDWRTFLFLSVGWTMAIINHESKHKTKNVSHSMWNTSNFDSNKIFTDSVLLNSVAR